MVAGMLEIVLKEEYGFADLKRRARILLMIDIACEILRCLDGHLCIWKTVVA